MPRAVTNVFGSTSDVALSLIGGPSAVGAPLDPGGATSRENMYCLFGVGHGLVPPGLLATPRRLTSFLPSVL